jgi:hypothetical protein
LGDRVIQTVDNYTLDVFNGDTCTIQTLEPAAACQPGSIRSMSCSSIAALRLPFRQAGRSLCRITQNYAGHPT